MPIPSKPSYTHGSTGTQPGSSIDYSNGDALDADNFDYYVNTPFEKVKGIIDFLNDVDSDGDATVDNADNAADADQLDGYNTPLPAGAIGQLDSSIESIEEGPSGNLPSAGTEGRIYFETSNNRVLYDTGSAWDELGRPDSSISLANLGSNAHSDLSAIGPADHHAKYTDEEAQDASGNIFDSTLDYDDAAPSMGVNESANFTWLGSHEYRTAINLNEVDTNSNGTTNVSGTQIVSGDNSWNIALTNVEASIVIVSEHTSNLGDGSSAGLAVSPNGVSIAFQSAENRWSLAGNGGDFQVRVDAGDLEINDTANGGVDVDVVQLAY